MEFALINQLKSSCPPDTRLNLGIGDDCALLPQNNQYESVFTTDMLLDGVHFRTEHDSLERIARKSLAVNISDIAAMAATPLTAFISLAIPRSWSSQQAQALFRELANAASHFEISIAGGDTNTWNHPLAINVLLYGSVPAGQAILRSGSQIGDLICVSGPLGGSILEKQFSFQPRVKEAQWLRQNAAIHAMIDISDGLLADLGHLLEARHLGAELFCEKIPISPAASSLPDQLSPLEHALADGEDFELLWTVSRQDYDRLMQLPERPLDIFSIGSIIEESGCFLVDAHGTRTQRECRGFEHQLQDAT